MSPKTLFLVLFLILIAVALFLIFHDDHDDSYTRSENNAKRKTPPSTYRKSGEPRVAPLAAPRVAPQTAPKAAPVPPSRGQGRPEKVLDFDYLLRIPYDPTLPERTMSSFIAGLQGFCTPNDLGGVVGYVVTDSVTGAMEVHASDDSLMGFLPMKDRSAYLAFNPGRAVCPFAGHIGISTTGRYYADIRIVLPSSHPFVLASLHSFLG